MSNNSFRTIQSVGRHELINELMESSSIDYDFVKKGPGDDAAVLEETEDNILLSSESFMEGVDFDLSYVPLNHLGHKIGTAAVSDIYAMNGTPKTVLVDVSAPNKISVDMLKEIYKGISSAGHDYEFQIVGGDLTASHQVLSISISCYGSVPSNESTYRSGAQKDDAICVTGDLGGAIAGLRVLMREKKFWEEQNKQEQFQPQLDEYEYVVQRQLLPIARKDFVQDLAKLNFLPTSMIDLTQGLVSDLRSLNCASNCGSYIYQSAFPIALPTRNVADEMSEDVDKYALYGGEDFEMMFTLPEKNVERMMEEFEDMTVIGKITDQDEGLRMQQAKGDVVAFDESDDATGGS